MIFLKQQKGFNFFLFTSCFAQSSCSKDSKKKGFSLGRPCFYHGHKTNQQKSLFFGRVIFLESLDQNIRSVDGGDSYFEVQ